jgi:hypothetical protein
MDSPGMIMRLPNVGSQYLMGFTDADKNYLDGGKTYKVTLPKDIPAEKFWSFTVYDNQTRSMLQTPQRYPRAGSQTYRRPPQSQTPMVQRRFTSDRRSRTASSGVIGFRRCLTRAGS